MRNDYSALKSKESLLFLSNIYHPSLNFELLEPRELGNYSFRLDIHYRVIFIFHTSEIVEIISITNHYR
ncbi:MAG: hypothetical protein WAV41_00705 [Microgenomates group bacterium]